MPKGMLLRSSWRTPVIAEYRGTLSLTSYGESTRTDIQRAVPPENSIDCGMAVRAAVRPVADVVGGRPQP